MSSGKRTAGWYFNRRNWGWCLYTTPARNPVLTIAMAGRHFRVGSRYWDAFVFWLAYKKAELKERYGR